LVDKLFRHARVAAVFASRTALLLGFLLPTAATAEPLELLARIGPWPAVSELIGYNGRIWFANSVKFRNHNSADIHSYDPDTGAARYERHLFSQDAGTPTVAGGLLYWPFEDSRFSPGRAEFMVTNGRDWAWQGMPQGQAFHLHTMATLNGTLYAATSAWAAGLQGSEDGGRTWSVLYDHPTPPRRVSRITRLVPDGDGLYAGLTFWSETGPRVWQWKEGTLSPVPGWPEGHAVSALTLHRGALYAVQHKNTTRTLLRAVEGRVEPVEGLAGAPVRALASDGSDLWAVGSDGAGGGALWRSADGLAWTQVQMFKGAVPLDVLAYRGAVWVGTKGPGDRGGLYGPLIANPFPGSPVPPALPARPAAPDPGRLKDDLASLDTALADPGSYAGHGRGLRPILRRLAAAGTPEAGAALAERLGGALPEHEVRMFGGQLRLSAATMTRWYLLWAMARTGHGKVPTAFLLEDWKAEPNDAEKYLDAPPAAAWAVSELRQDDPETIDALVARLDRPGDPDWLNGDLIGALTVLTGQRFGYDTEAWRAWWRAQR